MRINLAEAIPLPAPFALFVEPTNVCNFRCGICPESLPDYREQAGYYQTMAPDTWNRICDSFKGWARLKVIRFYHTGEPLLNRNLAAMVRRAHEFADRVEVTTNGSLLTVENSLALILANLHYIRISVYGTSEASYAQETGRSGYYERVMQNVRNLRKLRGGRVNPRIHAELVTTEQETERKFYREWLEIADDVSVKSLHNWGSALVTIGAAPRKQVCPYPFYELAVKANGAVSVCCVDWANQLIVGNVHWHTLKEIWEGEPLYHLQAMHLSGQRHTFIACRECNVPDTCPDNLDVVMLRK